MVRLSANSIRVVEDTGRDSVEALDAAPETMIDAMPEPDHVGAWLREAREATGRDLRDVAAHLRIRAPYLEAIEEGRFDDLPGRAYAVGFIRSYCDYLGLDSNQMLERFKSEADATAIDQNLKFPTPAPEGRFPGTSVLIVSALLVAALVGGWYYYQSRGAVDLVRVPAPPADTQADTPSDTRVGTPGRVATGAAGGQTPVPVVAVAPQNADLGNATNVGNVAAAGAITPAQAAGDGASPANTAQDVVTAAAESSAGATGDAPPAPASIDTTARDSDDVAPSDVAAEARGEPVPVSEGTSEGEAAGETVTVVEPMAPPQAVASPAESVPMAEPAGEQGAVAPLSATPPPAAPEPDQVATFAEAPSPGETPAAPAVEVAALPPVPTVAPETERTGRVYGLSNRDARVVVSAQGDSWVQVRDDSQNTLLTRMLHAGDSYRVPNRGGLIMSVGNPSVLSVSVDGGEAFQLSPENVPISDIVLDPERLRDGTAIR